MTDNDIPYGDLTFLDSHPGTIAAIATLLGLNPPPVDTCRILELGCGTGFNLLAMSQSLPNAHCTGLDLGVQHVERARETAAAIGAANVEFYCQSIHEFSAPPASFDYIIAHGVYSWVPPEIRDALLAVMERHLAPNGVAYVSYNTYPGWRIRSITRDAMLFFAQPAQTTEERVQLARQGVEQLLKSIANPDSIYGKAAQCEIAPALTAPDYYLTHEYLAGNNFPAYFQDFVQHAGRFNLQYLAESRFLANSFAQGEETRAQLDAGGGSGLIRREQYLDFIVGRNFRQSLLCHAAAPVSHEPDAERLLPLRVALTATVLQSAPDRWRVRSVAGAEVEVDDEPTLRVLEVLVQHSPLPVPAGAMEGPVIEALSMIVIPGLSSPILAAVLISGWRLGLWAFRADQPALTAARGPRPTACPLARLQAAAGPACTNRLHQPVTLTEDERALLRLLDGTHETDSPLVARLSAQGFLIA